MIEKRPKLSHPKEDSAREMAPVESLDENKNFLVHRVGPLSWRRQYLASCFLQGKTQVPLQQETASF